MFSANKSINRSMRYLLRRFFAWFAIALITLTTLFACTNGKITNNVNRLGISDRTDERIDGRVVADVDAGRQRLGVEIPLVHLRHDPVLAVGDRTG